MIPDFEAFLVNGLLAGCAAARAAVSTGTLTCGEDVAACAETEHLQCEYQINIADC